MKLLLDTHVALWALAQPGRLPASVRASLADPENDVYLSAASTWEIVIKGSLGKLDADADQIVGAALATGFTELPVTSKHALRLRALPSLHRDPFDRILVAQALQDGLTLVTRDADLAGYGVPLLTV